MNAKNDNRDHDQKNTNESANIPETNASKPMDSKRDVENANDAKIEQDFPGYPHYPAKDDIMGERSDNHKVDMDVENLPNTNNKSGVSQRFPDEKKNDQRGNARTVEANDPNDFSDIGPRTEISEVGLETLGSENAEIGVPQNVDDSSTRVAGTDLTEEDSDLNFDRSTEADVTLEERAALEGVSMPTQDEDNLRRAALDTTDFDGEQLNEESFGEVVSGSDLDVPQDSDDIRTTSTETVDEENENYSLGGDRHDTQEEDPQSGPARDNY